MSSEQDANGLAERIAEYAVAATHVYAMMSNDPAYLQRLRDREEAKKQEMMPHIAEMLAPLLAENERLRAENLKLMESRASKWQDDDSPQAETTFGVKAESERRLKLLVECRDYVASWSSEREQIMSVAARHLPATEVARMNWNLEPAYKLLTRIDAETGGK